VGSILLGISILPPSTFGDFRFTVRNFGGSHFTARWTEKDRFPMLQQS